MPDAQFPRRPLLGSSCIGQTLKIGSGRPRVRLATRNGIIVVPTAPNDERNPMLKLTVLYNRPEDAETFEDYYANERLPLAAKMPNVLRFESGRVGTVDGSEPPYHRIAEFWFESAGRPGGGVGPGGGGAG